MSDLKTRLELLDEILAGADVTDVTADAGFDRERNRVWTTADGKTRILVHAVDHIGRLMCDVITTYDGRDHVWLKVRHWEHDLIVRVLVGAGVVRLADDGEDAGEEDPPSCTECGVGVVQVDGSWDHTAPTVGAHAIVLERGAGR